MFCKNCGKELKDGLKFCPSCGEQTGDTTLSSNAVTANQNQQAGYQNFYQAPVANDKKEDIVSIGQYMGWAILQMIPIVGWIVIIVFALDSSKMNRANYARAAICMWLLGILLAMLLGGSVVALFAGLLS
ncbi:MAG: zinc-ribbon domain-containing protein [Anaerobutyricum sp.]